MLKKYPLIKWSLITIGGFIVILFLFGYWFFSLLPSNELKTDLTKTQAKELPYLSMNTKRTNGKILAVVTSCDLMGSSLKKTGYELTELSRAYYVFNANGYEVDIASPKGGKAPVIIDKDDMGAYDYAFLNDSVAQHKTHHTIPMKEVVPTEYDGVFFVGGKGAVFDFPQNLEIQTIVKEYYQEGKVIGAVCHGPAALVNVVLDDGTFLLQDKKVSGFTNTEELFLIPDAETIFPFLLQDELMAKGAAFKEGYPYLENVSEDKKLVTGGNPWSTWSFAEAMVRQLGHTPVKRTPTAEENAVEVLLSYETGGYKNAKDHLGALVIDKQKPVKRSLLAMHAVVASMQWKLGKASDLLGLVSYAKKITPEDN